MKTKKYYLILAVVIGILCVPALGETELPRFEQQGLIGRTNPNFAGIEQVYIELWLDTRISHVGIKTLQDIHEKVERKLDEGGIKIYPRPFGDANIKPPRVPEIRIDIGTLKLEDFQQIVFRIQTSLARTVCLKEEQQLFFKADVWKTEPVMQVVSVESMPAKVTGVVLEQVEAFIYAYLAANPQGAQPADVNEVTAVIAPTTAKRAVKPKVGEYQYVASKNSKVFHRPDCTLAKRIKPKNLVGYNSRNDAIKAGKRPCKICKP